MEAEKEGQHPRDRRATPKPEQAEDTDRQQQPIAFVKPLDAESVTLRGLIPRIDPALDRADVGAIDTHPHRARRRLCSGYLQHQQIIPPGSSSLRRLVGVAGIVGDDKNGASHRFGRERLRCERNSSDCVVPVRWHQFGGDRREERLRSRYGRPSGASQM